MELQNLAHIRKNQFCQEHCKITANKDIAIDKKEKCAIIEAWAHVDLLDDKSFKKLVNETYECKQEHCQECNNTLC